MRLKHEHDTRRSGQPERAASSVAAISVGMMTVVVDHHHLAGRCFNLAMRLESPINALETSAER